MADPVDLSRPRAAATVESPVVAATADTAIILVFAALGRLEHDELITITEVLWTAWPFLAGAAIGWLVNGRCNRFGLRAGLLAWAGAWTVGMLLRALTEQGTAPAFMVVAAVFLLLLPGWRAGRHLLSRARRRG